MKKKWLSASMLLLALTLVLSACGGSKNSSDDGKTAAGGGSSSGGSGDKVTIKMMHLWPDGSNSAQNKLAKQIISEYEQANPNVKIETEVLENEQYKNKLKVLSASNSLPDVGFTWAAGFLEPYVKGNMFAPLDDLLQGDLKDKFVAGTTEAYAVDGKTYALPVELNIVPVYYNKEIFAKYNLQPPKTYEEFKNIIKTLNDNKVTPIALGSKDAWTGSFWYMYLAERLGGPDMLDQAVASSTFSDSSLIQAAKEAQDLVKSNAFVKGFNGLSNDEAKSEFMNEKAAMYAMGTWEVPNYTTNPDIPQEFKDKIGFFKFPTIEGGKGNINDWVGGVGVGMFVSENSKVKEDAKKFVNYFVKRWGELSVVDAGIIPGTKVDTSSVKLPQMFIDVLNELNNASKVILYLDVQMKPGAAEEHYNLIQALLGNAITPEEFAKKQEEALKTGK
ncbi:ABC transporter substrate-binding protein [Paenibacillus sp. SSG-1]|uniref:ABC transporter substrate-binding protein n=1 Tax=Paenibacillus cineris TaxID=237530 RepID=A0ABQ4L6P4_9BACL|nr:MULTISPECIES: extracellular solute-binding protein [Paenibacillus]OXL81974.1 ABC transporter substrate-binding protein [Paenibacillus sp. SSG-1]UYO04435.1 extracellular solute-binding protein [Paenibacillus sp. PSB04]GIO52267.1 ABC transporter substrate-binding protein [Paenibacillus cineris]GIO62273.1 ABC transporter substrate-binding protein [Paenibacillus cineris]